MRPTVTLKKKISYPRPSDTTAVAELTVTSSTNIDDAIFVCKYIPVSVGQEPYYEFYNVAYADQMQLVPKEPETLNRECFVRRNVATYYAASPLTAQNWCEAVYREIQRLLQSYNVNYPLGSCDKVELSEDDINVTTGVTEDDPSFEDSAAGSIFLATETEDGTLVIPDGYYPVGLEHNEVIYRVQGLEHDIDNSVFIINTERIRAYADIAPEKSIWKVWCIFGEEPEGENSMTTSCGSDVNVAGIVVNATESSDGHIEINDKYYPVSIEHNGRIYSINEVIHDDDSSKFIISTNEVRVLADFAGVKSYWSVWCIVKAQHTCDKDDADSDKSENGMIW